MKSYWKSKRKLVVDKYSLTILIDINKNPIQPKHDISPNFISIQENSISAHVYNQ